MIGKSFLFISLLLFFGGDDRTSSFVAARSAKSDLQRVQYDTLDFQNIRIKRQDEDAPLELEEGSGAEEVIEEIIEEVAEPVDEAPPVEDDQDDIESLLGLDGDDQATTEEGSGSESGEASEDDLSEDVNSILGLDDDNTKAVLETPPPPPTTPAPFCTSTPYGCCSINDTIPSHGHREEGCCLLSEFGCCQDQITVAAGLDYEGCSCDQTDYGCCPDLITAARGQDNLGCGCSHSPFGCCPDQVTVSPGANQEGCPCYTFEHGCCPDGITKAQGLNLEGCADCSTSEFGCCPDNFTPASENGCGCEGSEFGCCPDGLTTAEGADFEGCNEIPGQYCDVPKNTGNCQKQNSQNFTIKWFFDLEYGGCSRFWFANCATGDQEEIKGNNFETEKTCEKHCVTPQGSGRCYLPKVTGPCKASLTKFYFDRQWNKCMEFSYSGCLGNGNNFETIEECNEACTSTPDDLPTCSQPFEPGACRGEYQRWYYDSNDGLCYSMNYTGCKGNANRFMSQEECKNACLHESKLVRSRIVCSKPKMRGLPCASETMSDGDVMQPPQAKWYFDKRAKTCLPFYYLGCGGNDNLFDSWDECEEACPNAFPPEIEVAAKVLVIEEGHPVLLSIQVEANPPPNVNWQKDGTDVTLDADERMSQLENGSLNIASSQLSDSGTWTVIAENGLGQVERKQIELNVHPSSLPITVTVGSEKDVLNEGEEIKLTCEVQGYPIPVIRWYKNNVPLSSRGNRIQIFDDHSLVITGTSTIDGGSYSCRATNEHESVSDRVDLKVEKAEEVEQCIDKPSFARCDLIVKAKYCNKNAYYAEFCCASCVQDGQLGPNGEMLNQPPQESAEESEESEEASGEGSEETEEVEEETEEEVEGEVLEEEEAVVEEPEEEASGDDYAIG